MSWIMVLVTPDSRRLKFGAMTSTSLISTTVLSWRLATRQSAPGDGEDLVGLGAAGRDDLDRFAGFLADHRARDRRRDGDAASLYVGFLIADDLIGLFLFGVFVDQFHGRAELDLGTGHFREIDHL